MKLYFNRNNWVHKILHSGLEYRAKQLLIRTVEAFLKENVPWQNISENDFRKINYMVSDEIIFEGKSLELAFHDGKLVLKDPNAKIEEGQILSEYLSIERELAFCNMA